MMLGWTMEGAVCIACGRVVVHDPQGKRHCFGCEGQDEVAAPVCGGCSAPIVSGRMVQYKGQVGDRDRYRCAINRVGRGVVRGG